MIFNNIKEAEKALDIIQKNKKGKYMHYPPLFKNAIVELGIKEELSVSAISTSLNLKAATIYSWKDQHNRGLYTLKGTYNVSQNSLDMNKEILDKLHNEIEKIQSRITLVEQCSKVGMKVTA